MAELDHYEVNTYGNTTRVEPKYREGCLPKVAIVVVLVVLFAIFRACGVFDKDSNAGQVHTEGIKQPASNQGSMEKYPNRANLAELYVFGDHSSVVDNIRAGTVTDSYGNTYPGPYFVLTSINSSGYREAYTELVTGGEYMYLSGTYFADADYDEYETTFRIYADGVLVYDSGIINRRNQPIKFDVCIDEAQLVKVSAVASNVGVADAAHLILVNAEVRK